MAEVWDLSKKKWLYWTAVIGFIITFQVYLWIIGGILYIACDKGKPKTQNYQISKVSEKYIMVVGNLGFLILCICIFGIILRMLL